MKGHLGAHWWICPNREFDLRPKEQGVDKRCIGDVEYSGRRRNSLLNLSGGNIEATSKCKTQSYLRRLVRREPQGEDDWARDGYRIEELVLHREN